jgi:ABC-type taurine transport system ATPase subunit
MLTACASRAQNTDAEPAGPAMVRVENQDFNDMVIYAISGGQRVRLGLATGNSTKTFTIPRYLTTGAGPILFLADPIGGNQIPVREEMSVRPGDLVTLTIPPQ